MNKDWLDIDVLEDYLDGKLDAKTMNRVKREALEDPFVAEALAGLSASPKRALASISLLQRQLQERIAKQQIDKKQSVITWQRLSIGSAAAVLFITVGVMYWMKQVNYTKTINSSKNVEVVLAPIEQGDTVASTKVTTEALSVPQGDAIAGVNKTKRRAVELPEPSARPSVLSSRFLITPTVDGSDIVTGKVIDELTGNPMVGASVSVKDKMGNLRVVASANEKGEFSFKKDDTIMDSTVTVSYIAYESKILSVKSNEPLAISLKESQNSLNEVAVVRGYVSKNKSAPTGSTVMIGKKEVADIPVANVDQLLQGKVAGLNIQNSPGAQSHPMEGWDHYYMYIANNSKFKGEPRVGKSVELSFGIDTSGVPQGIRVIKGISSKYDKEAVRLIKEGPKWLPSEPLNKKIFFKVDF